MDMGHGLRILFAGVDPVSRAVVVKLAGVMTFRGSLALILELELLAENFMDARGWILDINDVIDTRTAAERTANFSVYGQSRTFIGSKMVIVGRGDSFDGLADAAVKHGLAAGLLVDAAQSVPAALALFGSPSDWVDLDPLG